MIKQPTASVASLTAMLARLCPEHRIDLAGAVTLPCPLPHQESLDRLAAGHLPGVEYLTRDIAGRLDPTLACPWARSILVFAQRYTAGWSPEARRQSLAGLDTADADNWLAGVSRYARGRDYHDVLLADIKAVLAGLATEIPELHFKCAVDTGPYCEREYAHLAGLGFFGKNTCLIHERLGSGLFLGVALTNLEVVGLPAPSDNSPAGRAVAEPLFAVAPRTGRQDRNSGPATRCGRCTRCIDACPTQALDGDFSLDSSRCLAMLTIEQRGNGPDELRHRQAGLLFGCDICQAVCPWNDKAARLSADRDSAQPAPCTEYRPLPQHDQIVLVDLMTIAAAEFGQRFRHTPLWRCHPEGMRRNTLTVAANRRLTDTVKEVQTLADADPDPDVRRVAQWALSVLSEPPEEK